MDERIALVIWAAGFFDGEGSVSIQRLSGPSLGARSGMRYTLRLNVPQIVIAPLERLQQLWGGSIRLDKSRSKGRPLYVWSLTTGAARRMLIEVTPFLLVKRAQAELGLEFLALMNPIGAGRTVFLDEAAIAKRAAIKETLKQLNNSWHVRLKRPLE